MSSSSSSASSSLLLLLSVVNIDSSWLSVSMETAEESPECFCSVYTRGHQTDDRWKYRILYAIPESKADGKSRGLRKTERSRQADRLTSRGREGQSDDRQNERELEKAK